MEKATPLELMRVLILDDDANVRNICLSVLKHHGFKHVSTTASPQSALHKIQRGIVDIALVDWMLPEVSGLEVLKAIKNTALPVGVIMITSMSDREDVMEAVQAGCDDYLVKPFSGANLMKKLEELKKKMDSRLDKPNDGEEFDF